jgi:RHS repeat-associated protein
MSISGTINGTTESAAYSYDNLGRLVTSNQTSNGSSAQRRFAFDRWGNRTGMWDATSGGEQIQSIALQGSGGIPTNQIESVTVPEKDPFSVTYDAAGNVTDDDLAGHSYGYDSENRLVSVDGGSTASYAYDHQNRRYKKTVGSTVTHYVWQGYQAIAEHNGSTGAVLIDYVFSGSKMISKVAGGSATYFLNDRLSVRVLMDSSGSVSGRHGHLPFGEDFAASGGQGRHQFTSYESDSESGSDYAINRQFSQAVGRFMRPDPYSGSYSLHNPKSLNRYSYVHNDPRNATDRLGLCLCIGYYMEDDGHGNEVRWVECFLCQRTRAGGSRGGGGQDRRRGGGARPPREPCLNSDGSSTLAGFVEAIGNYSTEDLNAAVVTLFGELDARKNASREEAEAIASTIFNRAAAIANGSAPGNGMWGSSPSLTAVVSAPSQFNGWTRGQDLLRAIKDEQSGELYQGDRQCTRLQTIGSAIAFLAENPGSRQPFLYMCASFRDRNTQRPLGPGEQRIGRNDFSVNPMVCP